MILCNLIFYKVTNSKKHEKGGSGGIFGDQIPWESIKMNLYDNLKISKTYVDHVRIYSKNIHMVDIYWIHIYIYGYIIFQYILYIPI